MNKFFTHERFGKPQFLAGLLLLVLLAQCLYLVGRENTYSLQSVEEIARIQAGLELWGKQPAPVTATAEGPFPGIFQITRTLVSGDRDHSALWYLINSAPLLPWGTAALEKWTRLYWLPRLPNLLFALLLGASLWYVARRLYGNAGGYIALAFYCFSPAIIISSAAWLTPEMGAAWGAFGAIFTAIAVAHTLYAPREVVLWNWRRILLLGLSFALAVGSQFSLIVLLPFALGFMFYLAPARKRAAFAIWISAFAVALVLLLAAYSFHLGYFLRSMRQENFFPFVGTAYIAPSSYWALLRHTGELGPAIIAALPVVLIIYLLWRRTRYFGNTAPLLVALLLLVLGLGAPHYPGFGYGLMAVPFLFVFVAGVIADLLETANREIVLLTVWVLFLAGATWNFWQLARMG